MSRHFSDAISPNDLVDARASDGEPEIEHTHYIPELAPVFRGEAPRRQRAFCGEFIDVSEHSPDPTCQRCAQHIAEKAADEADTFTALGCIHVNGVWQPAEVNE